LTTFLIDDKVDTGNVLLRDEFEIPEGFTAGDLHDFMMPRAVEIGLKTIELLKTGDYTPLKQDDSIATPAPKIFPENGIIYWSLPTLEVMQLIHGFSPIPGARTRFNNQLLKIYRVKISEEIKVQSGNFLINKSGFYAGCCDGVLQILEFQPEGKKTMSFKEFINGYRGLTEGKFDTFKI
jgi:methionyl-tRNA formyltransferase